MMRRLSIAAPKDGIKPGSTGIILHRSHPDSVSPNERTVRGPGTLLRPSQYVRDDFSASPLTDAKALRTLKAVCKAIWRRVADEDSREKYGDCFLCSLLRGRDAVSPGFRTGSAACIAQSQ